MERRRDISVLKLINYNLIFFIPLILLYLLAFYFSHFIAPVLGISRDITIQSLMVVLSLVLFFILIPFFRIRETIKGVRFSLFNFVVMGFVITIPSLLRGNYSILMSAMIYLANFIFATFINCPDVIGVSGDPEDWFKHKVQITIFIIYVTIAALYFAGFGWIYYQMANDPGATSAFLYKGAKEPSYFSLFYYSVVSMSGAGSSDITPVSIGARAVTILQVLLGMIINVVFIAILFMYISFSQTEAEKKTGEKIEREERRILDEEERIKLEESKIETEEDRLERLERQPRSEFSPYRAKYPNYPYGYTNRKN